VPFIHAAAQQIQALLQGPHRPTALVCSNDLLAIRSIRAAAQAGLRVPHDLSVVGFDGIALGLELTPMLSTISQPNADMGARSVSLLLESLARGEPLQAHQSITLPHQWRAGESCAPAP
jgi:DNA-binding LacI/PurR family transcriptional regulator